VRDDAGVTGGRVTRVAGYAVALGGPPLLSYALHPLARGDHATSIAFAFLLVVLAAAALGGLLAGVLASVAGFAAYNLTFVRPYGRLAVAARRDAGVLAGFLVAGLVVSVLVDRLAARRAQAEREADEARLLYRLGVAAADDPEVGALAAFAAEELGASAVVVAAGDDVLYDGGLGDDAARRALRTPPAGAVVARAPLAGGDAVTVVVLPAAGRFDARRRPLLDALASRVATTVDRARLRTESRDRALLEASEQQRAALVSGVSHDLRTPLAAIKASASALTAPGVGDADRPALTASIGIEVDRLDRMVRNLLDLGRIESGRLVAHPEPVPLDELVGSVLARLRPYLRERRLELDVPGDLPAAFVDPVQGEQALGNLVENVIAHTPLNAGLIVRAAARASWVTLRVADEGPGIAEHERARIFERFARGTHAGPGSGLGLAIARAYAEANGGGLDVAPSDCGAAFDLWLPAAS
jgi:two-component system, OmpR family, sensor histidine kinase KdpD